MGTDTMSATILTILLEKGPLTDFLKENSDNLGSAQLNKYTHLGDLALI